MSYGSVHEWLVSLGCGQYSGTFADEAVEDMDTVLHLRESDLEALRVKRGHIVKMRSSIESMLLARPQSSSSSSSASSSPSSSTSSSSSSSSSSSASPPPPSSSLASVSAAASSSASMAFGAPLMPTVGHHPQHKPPNLMAAAPAPPIMGATHAHSQMDGGGRDTSAGPASTNTNSSNNNTPTTPVQTTTTTTTLTTTASTVTTVMPVLGRSRSSSPQRYHLSSIPSASQQAPPMPLSARPLKPPLLLNAVSNLTGAEPLSAKPVSGRTRDDLFQFYLEASAGNQELALRLFNEDPRSGSALRRPEGDRENQRWQQEPQPLPSNMGDLIEHRPHLLKNHVKCVVVGDNNVGKTALLITYTTDVFPMEYTPSIFTNWADTKVVDGKTVIFTLYDTSGQDDYDRLRPCSYFATDVFLILFSVTSMRSLEAITRKWYPELAHHCPYTPCIIVGAKADLRDTAKPSTLVPPEDAASCARALGMKYMECSAMTGKGLQEVFDEALRVGVEIPPMRKKTMCRLQ